MTKHKIAVLVEDGSGCEDWRLMLQASAEVDTYSRNDEFLQSEKAGDYDCVLVDSLIAGELHVRLTEARVATPLIWVAAEPSLREAVGAVKLGAVDYLSTPVAQELLQSALEEAARLKRTGVPERFWGTETGLEAKLDSVERELICEALHRAGGVVGGRNGAAALLRVTRTGLLYKMKRLGITRPPSDSPETESGEAGAELASAAAYGTN